MTKRDLDESIDLKKNMRRYFRAIWEYKFYVLLILILISFIEILVLLDKVLFKLIIDKGTLFATGELIKSEFTTILISIALAYMSIVIIRLIARWVSEKTSQKFESELIQKTKNRFFNHLLNLSHNFHTTHKTGSLISRMGRGVRSLERINDFLIYNVVPLVVQVIAVGGVLFIFSMNTGIVIFVTIVLFIAYSLLISNIQRKSQNEYNKAEDREKGRLADFFMNIDSIKYFGKEDYVGKKFKSLTEDTKIKNIKFWDYGIYFSLGQSLLLALGTFFLLFFSIRDFMAGNITIGTLAFIYTAYIGLMGPLFGFVWNIRMFHVALGDMEDLFNYEEIENEIKDKPEAKNINITQGRVKFNDISFGYKDKGKAINNLSLEINPNEKIALVGHSGCGKTTLIKLIYRLYDLDSGSILIDGQDIKNVKQASLRSELSIVPQEAILFDDTIYNNILFSRPNAKREEVMKAIKFAQLDKFVNTLPKKENTIVGERGVKLSGGEKQRVSIARAILANKKILILDEATSALDSKTEHEIQSDLEKLMRNRTSIIIAHRLSTIMKADKIVVMSKGKIAQIGTHSDLINQKGIYKELWGLQKGGYIKE